MKRLLQKVFPVILTALWVSAVAQTTITTIPPLTANNGSTAITFEINSTSSIFVTGFSNTFNSGTINAEVWYRVGGVLHSGATTPNVTTANGWLQAGTATVVSTTNTAPTAIPIANLSIPVNPGTAVGFAITGGTRYMTYVTTNQTDFTAGGATLKTGPGHGFGGTFPAPTIATRQFVGSVTFVPAGPCTNPPFVGAATTDKPITCSGENFTLGLDTFTSGTGQSYQWQLSPNNTTWTNVVGATGPQYQTSQTATNYYRCVVSCTASDTSSSVLVTTTAVALPGGNYTINGGLATGGTNFNSFSDFKQAIVCGGIAGPLVVNVINKGSVYNEQVEFGQIGGASAINTITLKGNGQTISYNGGAQRATLLFNGTEHFNVKNLKVEGTATTNCYGIQVTGGSAFLDFDSCQVSINPAATSSLTAAFVVSGSLTSATTAGASGENLHIANCTIEGGYYALTLTGPSGAPYNSGNVVENNIIRDAYLYQSYLSYQDSLTFTGNDINRANRTGTITTFYGVYVIGNATDLVLTNNRIHDNATQNQTASFTSYCMYLSSANATVADPALIANNAFYNLQGVGTTYAMYIPSGNNLNIYHNTISVDNALASGSSTQRAFYLTSSSGTFNVKNNVFNMTQGGAGTKHLVYISSTSPTVNLNYNHYNMASPSGTNHIGYYGGSNYSSFAAWQGANSGAFAQDGVYGDPIFDLSNYNPQSSVGNNAGENLLAVVPTDLDGVARTIAPDMGALEYVPLSCLQPNILGGIATPTSFTIDWNNDPDADSVSVEYGLSGFVQGTGAKMYTTGSSITVTGLWSETCYDVYLTTYCGGSIGNGYAFYTICTKCGPKATPLLENFDANSASNSSANPGLPDCWSYFKSPSHTGYAYTYSSATPNSPANHVRFYSGATQVDTLAIISPAIMGITNGDKRVVFWGKSGSTGYNQQIVIGTTESPDLMGSLVILDTVEATSTYTEFTVYLDSANGYNGTHQYVVVMQAPINGTFQSLYVDDILIEQVPNCNPPTLITAPTIGTTTAQIAWSSLNGTCFDLEWGLQGFTQATGQGNIDTNVTSAHTITGLTANTHYDVYVRDCCNPNVWEGPFTFKTNCLSQLNGTYTINQNLPASATNFESIVDFVESANNCGISGAVTANIVAATGPYNEQVIIQSVPGISATNTITINGNGNALYYASTNTSLRGTFILDGASFITIENLEIEGAGSGNSYGVEMRNGASDITFDSCYIHTDISVTTSTVNPFVMSDNPTSPTTTSGAFNNVTVKNSIVEGGYYGFILNGPTAAPYSTNNVIENTEIRDFYLYGIYARGQNGSQINGNDITRANRTAVSSFYAMFLNGNMEGVTINANQVHNNADGSPGATSTSYPFYFSSAEATAANPLLFSNNLLYNINTAGTTYGMYIIGSSNHINIYHNTLSLGYNGTSTGTQRVIYSTASTSGAVIKIRNNVFNCTQAGTGTKHLVYLSNTSPAYTINYNQYNMNAGGTNNHIGYYSGNKTTFANWQAANSGAFEVNGVQGDPVFASPTGYNMTPLNNIGNNNGLNQVNVVPFDFYGVARSNTPDRGAIKFTPLNADLSLTSAMLEKGECLSTMDTVYLAVKNLIGSSINLATSPITATWELNGPVNSSGTITWNTGSLGAGMIDTNAAFTADLSVPGVYILNAYLPSGTNNQFGGNDTLLPIEFEVFEIFKADPRMDTVTNATDSVELSVQSPFMGGGSFFFSEVCHFRGSSTGAPSGGWPAYLTADDFVEITGVPGSDLGGLTLEQWSTSSITSSHTFAPGTVIGPNGTAIIAVGQLGSSTPSPSNFYYHGNGTYTGSFGSSTAAGRILKDGSGNIIDAHGYSGFSFPASANVTSADWSASASGGSGTAGQRLTGPDNNTGSNWVVSSSSNTQTPNVVNTNVPVPSPQGVTGFTWSHNGNVIDTNVTIKVGPWANPGVYKYVASFTNSPCGVLYDTATVYVMFSVACGMPSNVAAANLSCAEFDISWNSDTAMLTSYVEYGAAGFTPGTGTLIAGAMSPLNISGLTPGTGYDVYIVDSCAAGMSNPAMQAVTTPIGPVPTAVFSNTITVTFSQADVQFDASASANYDTLAWDFGDGSFGSGVSPMHTYNANGTYTVVLTATNGCGVNYDTVNVVVAGISIDESLLAKSLNVYPNPSNGIFRVDFEVEGLKEVEVRVFSLIGQPVYVSTPGNVSGRFSQDVDLSSQPAGVYILQLTTEDGTLSRRLTLNK